MGRNSRPRTSGSSAASAASSSRFPESRACRRPVPAQDQRVGELRRCRKSAMRSNHCQSADCARSYRRDQFAAQVLARRVHRAVAAKICADIRGCARSVNAHARGELKRPRPPQRLLEKVAAQVPVTLIPRAAQRRPERPERPPWLSSEPCIFHPVPVVAHEIAEPPFLADRTRTRGTPDTSPRADPDPVGLFCSSSSSSTMKMNARALSSVQ